jgi:hypothetical protein
MYHQHIWSEADHANRHEVPAGIIARVDIHAGRDRHRRGVTEQNGIAIGRGLCDRARADGASCTSTILDDDRLTKGGGHFVSDVARHHRGAATGRKRDDQRNRPGRIVISTGQIEGPAQNNKGKCDG